MSDEELNNETEYGRLMKYWDEDVRVSGALAKLFERELGIPSKEGLPDKYERSYDVNVVKRSNGEFSIEHLGFNISVKELESPVKRLANYITMLVEKNDVHSAQSLKLHHMSFEFIMGKDGRPMLQNQTIDNFLISSNDSRIKHKIDPRRSEYIDEAKTVEIFHDAVVERMNRIGMDREAKNLDEKQKLTKVVMSRFNTARQLLARLDFESRVKHEKGI